MLVETIVDYRRAKHFLRSGLCGAFANGERSDVIRVYRQVRAVLLNSRHRQQMAFFSWAACRTSGQVSFS